jgi:hypothetical protein
MQYISRVFPNKKLLYETKLKDFKGESDFKEIVKHTVKVRVSTEQLFKSEI